MKTRRVVVAGGAGYIGSHVCVVLLEAGFDLLVIDNFDNSSPRALDRIRQITGLNDPERLQLLRADLTAADQKQMIIDTVVAFKPEGAVHLAGLKAVGDSVADPAGYYFTNINATLTLVAALEAAKATSIVFSSSATVYGELNPNPVTEDGQTGPTNPYGHTKHMIEQMLSDLTKSPEGQWKVCHLRYFNPVGAHPSGLIGEDPNGVPNNLFPYIAQVAVGRRAELGVFGDDYPTPDGTGVRDYIHVMDLAEGHLKALDFIAARTGPGSEIFNLGTGQGVSVFEALAAFGRAAGRKLPYRIAPRRPGDVAVIYADPAKANRLLDWKTSRGLDEMCADHWRWQSQNPQGYDEG